MSDDSITTKVRSYANYASIPTSQLVIDALYRLTEAARIVADVLDSGERDPTWHESQELEEAAIAYGRSVRKITPAPRGNGEGK